MARVCQNSLYKLKENVDAMFKWRTFFVLMYITRYLIWMADISLLSTWLINPPGLSPGDAEHSNRSDSTSFLS